MNRWRAPACGPARARADAITFFEAKNGHEAASLILGERPDLVFLDVQMPEMDGFDVVREVGAAAMPDVIFVTAHDQFAIQAFEINALDYLLKPVSEERFAEALQRTRSHLRRRDDASERIVSLLQTLVSPPKTVARIAVRSAGKTRFVDLADVLWIQAAENYVQLHTATSRHLVHATMQTMLARLDPEVFVRIHRSAIVNFRHIKQIETAAQGDYVLTLDNGFSIQSSRTYNEVIKRWVSNRP